MDALWAFVKERLLASASKQIHALIKEFVSRTKYVPIADAISYMMDHSKYGFPLTHDTDRLWLIGRELQQAAFDGQIEFRGHEETNRGMPGQQCSDIEKTIRPYYWEKMQLDLIACTDVTAIQEPQTEVADGYVNDLGAQSTPLYFKLSVNEKQLKKKFPPLRFWQYRP